MVQVFDRSLVVSLFREIGHNVLTKGVFRAGWGPWPPIAEWPQIMEGNIANMRTCCISP